MKNFSTMLAGIALFILVTNVFSSSEGQPIISPTVKPSPTDIKAVIRSKIPMVDVEYQSGSIVVLGGREDLFLNTNGTMAPLWNAIDIVKHYGYSLSEITTSGIGSQGNPTRFYAIMSKP